MEPKRAKVKAAQQSLDKKQKELKRAEKALQEVLSKMIAPDPNGLYVDATFGRGGHTRGMLGAISPRGSLHAGQRATKVAPRATGGEARRAAVRSYLHAQSVRPAGCRGGRGMLIPAIPLPAPPHFRDDAPTGRGQGTVLLRTPEGARVVP